MYKTIGLAAVSAVLLTSTAWAESSGTFRQAYHVGFGAQSSMDPVSNARVLQIIEKTMNRLVRPDLEGKPAPDLAVSWSSNESATEWTFQ